MNQLYYQKSLCRCNTGIPCPPKPLVWTTYGQRGERKLIASPPAFNLATNVSYPLNSGNSCYVGMGRDKEIDYHNFEGPFYLHFPKYTDTSIRQFYPLAK